MTRPLKISAEVRQALDAGQAVVALESTVISHGLPYPVNLKTAQGVEAAVRAQGAIPATIAVLDGQLCVGVSADQLEYLTTGKGIRKVSRRDLPVVVARREDGATTVAATATVAAWAGIEVFATGGIGGVHRDPPYDVSNDLPTLASTPVAVVCAGAKSILNLRATLEWLETAGVPVVGYRTDEFPAFYSRRSGLPVDVRADGPGDVAALIRAQWALGLPGGTLVVVPVPAKDELPAEVLEAATARALEEARARGIEGSTSTPFLLKWVARETEGASVRANVALLENNAAVAGEIAMALAIGPQDPLS
ncbi:MAG: pseudouridine-5'-phosphate glycosidase [Anaerolineae bacterium]|nr:pseudouridine-5'-phosphate glycosidase [Anaerolineae bacterium]